MKKRLLGLLAIFAALSSVAPARVGASPAYPMTCQIGPNMKWAYSGLFGLAQVTFTKSDGPVAKGLTAGQCAFDDRGVRPSEPSLICIYPKFAEMSFSGVGNHDIVTTTPSIDPSTQFLKTIITGQSKLFSFNVKNDANNTCFSIISFAP